MPYGDPAEPQEYDTMQPRTHDDGRNERQRQEHEAKIESEAAQAIERARQSANQARHDEINQTRKQAEEQAREARQRQDDIAREMEREDVPTTWAEKHPVDPDFRSKLPEGQIDHPGQLNRDNVTPAIPSAPHGQGGIVDPNSLGMDQGQRGVTPPPVPNPPEQWPKPSEGEKPKDEADYRAQPREGELDPVQRDMASAHMPSPNEPAGSNIASGDAGPQELPPLVLSDIDPDSIVAGSAPDFVLTITGSGFGPNCVVLFDDEEYETTGDQHTLTASIPVAAEPGTVDVEVARGEDLSEVLTFEFTAAEGERSSKKGRKPKKEQPRGKRDKKGKQQKGRR